MKKVDLNVDIGEGFPHDEALLDFATSANVCCGEHAGSWELTVQTIELCKRKGTRIGMHPGFPDRESLGRRVPSAREIERWLTTIHDQTGRFAERCKAAYVKPHGAWYNVIVAPPGTFDPAIHMLSVALLAGCLNEHRVPVMLLPGTRLEETILVPSFGETASGARPWVIREGFADRAYTPQGTLVPRTEPGAVLHDPGEIKAQVLRLAPNVDSICLHGDTPGCVEFAEMARKTLEDAGFEVGY